MTENLLFLYLSRLSYKKITLVVDSLCACYDSNFILEVKYNKVLETSKIKGDVMQYVDTLNFNIALKEELIPLFLSVVFDEHKIIFSINYKLKSCLSKSLYNMLHNLDIEILKALSSKYSIFGYAFICKYEIPFRVELNRKDVLEIFDVNSDSYRDNFILYNRILVRFMQDVKKYLGVNITINRNAGVFIMEVGYEKVYQ